MKRNFNLFALSMALLFTAFATFSCSDSDGNLDPDNGQVVKPDTDVPDPEGTIPLTMRNKSNGDTSLDLIRIDEGDNFAQNGSGWNQSAYFTTIGQVKGLGNVSAIPRSGWTGKIAVIPGNGYVVASYNHGAQDATFYRIYVTDYVTSVAGGVIGAEIKYQKPFKGTDESLTLDGNSLSFDEDGGSKVVEVTNKNFVPFSCSSSAGWCKVGKSGSSDFPFLHDGVMVTVDPQETLVGEQEATVTLTTGFGKKTTFKVLRSGAPIHLIERDLSLDPQETERYVALSTTYKLSDLQVQSNNAWCEAELVDQREEMARKMARVKYVNGEPAKATEAPKSFYVKLHVKANGGQSRNAEVVVKSKDGKASDALNIYQEGGYFNLNQKNIQVSAGETSQQIYFSTNLAPEQIQANSNESWCTAEIQGSYILINCSANPTEESRNATISLTMEGDTKPLGEISVTQKANTFNMSKYTIWFDKNSNNETVTIETELTELPEATASEDWCTISFNGKKMTIRATATTEDRTATITFKNKSAKVIVNQSKYAVDDTYSEGKIEGTVVYMKDGDRYIAKEVGEAAWSTENVATGATDVNDGEANTNIIKKIPNFEELYPAFALCDALNTDGVTGWFLPANYQLGRLPKNLYSWSSTELNDNCAYTYSYYYTNKISKIKVYAFHRF